MKIPFQNLKKLGVERLILPAIPSVLKTWTGSFGFSPMSEDDKLQLTDLSILNFEDTIMCQKLLLENPSSTLTQLEGKNFFPPCYIFLHLHHCLHFLIYFVSRT